MITKRLAVLAVVLIGGLSSVFFLPKVYDQPYGVILKMPDFLGDWKATIEDVSEQERKVLGAGTEFARAQFSNSYLGVKNFTIVATIILSGHDMSNSIHRPERCLDAQGWNLVGKRSETISIDEKRRFDVTELLSVQNVQNSAGKKFTVRNLSYYWFAGAENITNSHWSRALIDNRDRFLKGVNQRWAYVLISGVIPQANPGHEEKAEEWARETIRNFIAKLEPRIHGPTLKY